MRLALFGGTFDPIHRAHLAVASTAADRFHLDRVIFVPAAHPPHKAGVTHAPYEHRVRMAELACQSDPRFEVSRLEEGTARSYSIDTIQKVRASLAPADELFFIIGADAFAEIRTWRRWLDVAAAVTFLVVSRPGHVYDVPSQVRLERLDTLDLAVSSSEIRRSLSLSERPASVPVCVLDYIQANGLYGTKP
ncbi:MAG TPA: nicotinate-nucleotide adenylyltransferase [Candidatus Sulfopaludibacter sp.]|jgi:nicotinate-nucleotide adenylyltransferase|nr:nicotinate-nucleotide adenylyltransferase [Candidatus Sulfopaludibacter sp.]